MDLPVTKAWIKARKHDRYYRAAKRQAYRSRAAIKLAQIDDRYGVFREGDVVVDLGAAPGGWSQVARERVGPKGRVIAVDLASVPPLEGVEFLRGDFSEANVQARIFETLGNPADVVMSDAAPHLSGARSYDVARSLELAEAALSFAVRALRTLLRLRRRPRPLRHPTPPQAPSRSSTFVGAIFKGGRVEPPSPCPLPPSGGRG